MEFILPDKLDITIRTLLQLMQQRPDHTLLPKERKLIYNCFSDRKVYQYLALLIAHQVLPIWEKTFPENTLLKEIIQFTELILTGKLASNIIEEESEYFEYDERYLGLSNKWLWTESWYALSTVYEAMNVIISNSLPFQFLSNEQIEQGLPDELCQRVGDVASNAVLANSGINSVTYNQVFSEILQSKQGPHFDPEKRRQFWEWWLTKAIPQAWHLHIHQS